MPHVQINNEFIECDTVIYLESYGDDIDGDGSRGKPYRTLSKAINDYNGKTAFVMGEGTFDSVNLNNSSYTQPIIFVGQGKKTIFSVSSTLTISNRNPVLNTNVYFYNLIWDSNNKSGTNYIMLGYGSWYFYNIVFINVPNSVYSYFLAGTLEMYNCIQTSPSEAFLREDGEIQLTNCYGAFKSGYGTVQADWDYQTNIITDTPNLDENYNILDTGWQNTGTGLNPDGSQANIGLYGGLYAWDYVDKPPVIINSDNKLYTLINDHLIELSNNTQDTFQTKGIKDYTVLTNPIDTLILPMEEIGIDSNMKIFSKNVDIVKYDVLNIKKKKL